MLKLSNFFRDKAGYSDERPTVQLSRKDRTNLVSNMDPPSDMTPIRGSLEPRTPRHLPMDPTLPPRDANLGAVSRLEALIEKTPKVKTDEQQSGVKKLHRKFVSEFKEHSVHIERPAFDKDKSLRISESGQRLKTFRCGDDDVCLSSAKSVPNLVDIGPLESDWRPFFTRPSFQTILSNNLSVSLPFDLDEVPKPCDVTVYNDHFSLDKNILERSEQQRRKTAALRYRSSIRIMVRPEAPAGLLANVDNMAEISSDKSKECLSGPMPHRSIVKEQFR